MFALSALIATLTGLPCTSARTVGQTKPALTVERVYGREFSGSGGNLNGTWLADGKRKATLARSTKVPGGVDIVAVDVQSNATERLISASSLIPRAEKEPIDIESFELTPDLSKALFFTNSQKVWRANTRGDFWLFDLKKKSLHKIGGNALTSSLMFAKISPSGKDVGYVQGHNLFVQNVASGKITKLTNDGTEMIVNGTFDWVHEEELGLQDGWRWSPDGKAIAFWQLDTRKEPLFTMINNTDSTYPQTVKFPYPFAGGINASSRIGVVTAAGGKTKWMDVTATSESGYIARMDWAANSSELMIQKLNRLQNFADFRIANAKTGKSKSVFQDKDAAFIETSTNDASPTGVRWIENGQRFLAISEKDGWRHIYSISRNGGDVHLLTPGDFDVDSIQGVDEKAKSVYYLASPNCAYQRYLYQSSLIGNPGVYRVTPDDNSGTNRYDISPNGSFAVVTHSQFGVPEDRKVVSLPTHQAVRELGDNARLKAKLKAENLGDTKPPVESRWT
jgi:dipeptidyl-peptidase 4